MNVNERSKRRNEKIASHKRARRLRSKIERAKKYARTVLGKSRDDTKRKRLRGDFLFTLRVGRKLLALGVGRKAPVSADKVTEAIGRKKKLDAERVKKIGESMIRDES